MKFDPTEPAHTVFRIEEIHAHWIKRMLYTVIFLAISLALNGAGVGPNAGSQYWIISMDTNFALKRYKEKLIWEGETSIGQILQQDLSELSAGMFAERWLADIEKL